MLTTIMANDLGSDVAAAAKFFFPGFAVPATANIAYRKSMLQPVGDYKNLKRLACNYRVG